MAKIFFKNRAEAGQKLAEKLKRLNLKRPFVLTIPGGGVPVGVKVAQALGCPLGLIFVKKILFPMETSLSFGAICADKSRCLSLHAEGLPAEIIKQQTKIAFQKAKKQEKLYSKIKKEINLKEKTVVLIDDSSATGSTIMAAIKSIKKKKPKRIVIALP